MFCVTQIPETGETECKLVNVMWPNARTQAPRGRQTVGRKWLIRRGAAGGYSDGRWAGDVKYCLISNWQNLNRPMAFSLHHLIKQCKKVTEFVDIWTTGKVGGWSNMPIWHQFSWMPNWKVLRGGKKKWHHTTTQFPQMWVRRSTHTCTQQYDKVCTWAQSPSCLRSVRRSDGRKKNKQLGGKKKRWMWQWNKCDRAAGNSKTVPAHSNKALAESTADPDSVLRSQLSIKDSTSCW